MIKYLVGGEWQNGLPIEENSGYHNSQDAALTAAIDRLSEFTQKEIRRIKWFGVAAYEIDEDGTGTGLSQTRMIDLETFDWAQTSR